MTFAVLLTGSRCATSPGSISHTGRSFDWNNPSMNCLYHRTFLHPVPYIHESGIKPEIQKIQRLRNGCGIIVLLRQAGRREGAGYNGSGAVKGFKDGTAFKIRGTGGGYKDFQISFGKL